MRKFGGKILASHSLVQNGKRSLAAFGNARKIAAPFVFHPRSIEIIGRRSHREHQPRRIYRREYIRLVFAPRLILESYPSEKDAVSVRGERTVQPRRQYRILGAPAAAVALLIADENIIRLFGLRYRKDFFAQLLQLARLQYVNAAAVSVGNANGGAVVLVVDYRRIAETVDRGSALARAVFLNVFDPVSAQHNAPIDLAVRVVELKQLSVQFRGAVVLARTAELVGTFPKDSLFVKIQTRYRLHYVAIRAFAHRDLSFNVKRSAAAFA